MLQAESPILDVTVTEIYIEFRNAKGYNAHGFLNPAVTTLTSKYYANVRYSISNNADAAFVALTGVVGYAACGTPSILGFLDLTLWDTSVRIISDRPFFPYKTKRRFLSLASLESKISLLDTSIAPQIGKLKW